MTRWILFGVVIFLLLAPAACTSSSQVATPLATPSPATSARPSAAVPAPKPSPVAVPKAPTVNTVIAAGRLAFATDMKLTFGTSGKVSKVNVTELDKVTKGQILAQLDTTDLNQAVKTAEFAVKTAEFALTSAQLDRQTAEAAIKSADTDVSTAQEAVKSAGVDLDKYADALRKISYPYTYTTLFVDVPQALLLINDASRQISDAAAGMRAGLSPEKTTEISSKLQQALDNLNLTRDKLAVGQGYSELFATSTDAKGITTQNINLYWSLRAAQLDRDKAQVTVQNALNAVTKQKIAADNARTALTKVQTTEQKTQNDLDKARNDLNKAKDELQKASVVSPIDGIVADVNVKELDLLSSGNYASTIAVEVIDPSRMELVVKVNELDIPSVKIGQKVAVIVDALPDARISSTVSAISPLPVVDSGVVSYEVRIAFEVLANSALKAGMRATASITPDKL